MNPFRKISAAGEMPCDFRVVPVSLCGSCYDDLRAKDDQYFVVVDACDLSGKCEICGKEHLAICFKCRVKSKWLFMKKRGLVHD